MIFFQFTEQVFEAIQNSEMQLLSSLLNLSFCLQNNKEVWMKFNKIHWGILQQELLLQEYYKYFVENKKLSSY